MKKNIFKIYNLALGLFMPFLAFAQANTNTASSGLCNPTYQKSLQGYMCELYKIVGQYLLPVLMLAATGFFMWNIVKYIRFAESPEKRKEYRASMIWGIVALFVMVSIWGIIAILGGIVGTNTSVIPQITY